MRENIQSFKSYNQYRKATLKLDEPTLTQSKMRMEPEDGSEQNQLRYELYKAAFDRIKEGMNTANYYEVICLSDSLMSDRLGKLLQVVRRYDEEKYVTGSLGQTVHTLKQEMEDRGLDFGEDFDRLLDAVSGCEDSFDNKRNTSVHEFCVVTEDNLKYRVKNRDNFNKATAQLGATLTKCIVRDVDQILRKIYNDEFYGEE